MTGKMLSPTPPMGWNSWNTFFDKISEDLICTTADTMVEQGYLEAGYQYLIIDDCWASKERDEHGKLVPDPEKFPHGMKAVADYVHSKGLKFGIYSCCGVRTCARYPGSFEHEFSDAEQFAEWGIDYLKYDNCNRPSSQGSEMLYRRMGMALRNSGRDMIFAACQWGTEDVDQWIRSCGAHTYRSTIDIQDSWKSIESILLRQFEHPCPSSPDCFNDMDMLVVGMNGKGFNPEASIGGCTHAEYQTHFALWAMMNSPLIIGCDLRNADDEAKKILLNRDLIAINQDAECRSCYRLNIYGNPDVFLLVRPLSTGGYAVGFFNLSDTPACECISFWDMGLTMEVGQSMSVYDCITHEDLGLHREYFAPKLSPHGCQVYRFRMVK